MDEKSKSALEKYVAKYFKQLMIPLASGDMSCANYSSTYINSSPWPPITAESMGKIVKQFNEQFNNRPTMTEREWLTSGNPRKMLDFIGKDAVTLGSDEVVCDSIREIIGNPFRPYGRDVFVECPMCDLKPGSPVLCAECLRRRSMWNPKELRAWQNGTIPAIAQRIYDDQDFASLPILADAIEEAGCAEAAILDHLRGQELCAWCYGDGIDPNEFAIGRCRGCQGKGILPAKHGRKCWVLALFMPEQSPAHRRR